MYLFRHSYIVSCIYSVIVTLHHVSILSWIYFCIVIFRHSYIPSRIYSVIVIFCRGVFCWVTLFSIVLKYSIPAWGLIYRFLFRQILLMTDNSTHTRQISIIGPSEFWWGIFILPGQFFPGWPQIHTTK